MFSVTRTQEIKISRGDDSGTFALEVNLGTSLEPIMYEFLHAFSVQSSPKQLKVLLNKSLFSEYAGDNDDIYLFEYNYLYDEKGQRTGVLGWYRNGELVELNDIGISYIGVPNVMDRIAVSYFINHISEIYFAVFDIHEVADHYYFRKIFRNDGKVITQTNCGRGYSRKNDYTTVVDKKNILLRIFAEDTENMIPGEYRYQIKVKLYDRKKDEYIINTITHPTAFYVMD